MAYDFQQAVDAARSAVEKSGTQESKEYTYPIVYPQQGSTITVRVLFNPPSGQVVRLVSRHEKVPCYRSYGMECPICKVQEQVKDLTGADPFGRTKRSKSRGICFAQYISSTNVVKNGKDEVIKPGDLILFMFPWSVYQQINATIQAISQTPTGMDQAFCHSGSGMFIQVSVSSDFKYQTTPVPYFQFQSLNADGSPMNDEQFTKMLDEMESLSDQVIPGSITEEVSKQVQEYADAIYRQYITPNVASVGVPQGTAPVNASQIPQGATPLPYQPVEQAVQVPPSVTPGNPVPPVAVVDNTAPSSTPVQTPPVATGYPSCFGQHKDGDPKCICCPSEMMCMQPTPNDLPWK